MQHKLFRSFALSGLLAISVMAFANDAEVAGKLAGNWEGTWKIGDIAGKLTANINGVSGEKFKGDATWFGTQVGDLKLPISSAKVKEGKVFVDQPYGMSFEAKLSEDNKSMEGSWSSAAGNGPMSLKKID